MEKENIYDDFCERISKAIDLSGGPSEAVRRTGVTHVSLSRWKKGEADPSRTNLVKLAVAANVNIAWLATGEGPMIKTPLDDSFKEADAHYGVTRDTKGYPVDLGEFVFIPRYGVKAAAGYGSVISDEAPTFSMAFRRYWIENVLRACVTDLSVINVKGDSMDGVLNDGDTILVDHSQIKGDGLFVLRLGGELIVKRVQYIPGNRLRIISANPAYDTFDVSAEHPGNDFAIIGKVVWFGRTVA